MAQMGEEISFEDLEYLSELSLDAAPVLSHYEFTHENCNRGCRQCLLDQEFHHVLETTEDMNVRTFHLSKYLAGQAAQEYFGR